MGVGQGQRRPQLAATLLGGADRVEPIAFIGGAADCACVTATDGSPDITCAPASTRPSAALVTACKQGQGESTIYHVVWQILGLVAQLGVPLDQRLFTFVLRSNDVDALVTARQLPLEWAL